MVCSSRKKVQHTIYMSHIDWPNYSNITFLFILISLIKKFGQSDWASDKATNCLESMLLANQSRKKHYHCILKYLFIYCKSNCYCNTQQQYLLSQVFRTSCSSSSRSRNARLSLNSVASELVKFVICMGKKKDWNFDLVSGYSMKAMLGFCHWFAKGILWPTATISFGFFEISSYCPDVAGLL